MLLCMYVYVCVCVYIYIYMYVWIWIYTYLFQDSALYLIALSSFNCMQQILVNSLLIFFRYKFFLFPCYDFLANTHHLKVDI